jgi:hypothetical protein
MAKAKHGKHGKSAHAHGDHGHGDHAHDDHAHDDHAHDEPPPPPEPETPLWFTLLGGVLFLVFGLAFLLLSADDNPTGDAAKGEAAKRPTAVAVPVKADDEAARPRPASPPVRRLNPADLEKKRLARSVPQGRRPGPVCRIVPRRIAVPLSRRARRPIRRN